MNEDINLLLDSDAIPLWAASESLGIPYSNLLMRINRGKVEAYKVGRLWFMTKAVYLRLEAEGYKPRRKNRRTKFIVKSPAWHIFIVMLI